jgi:hypothetical protein
MNIVEKNQERELREKIKSGRRSCDGCVSKARLFGLEYCIENLSVAGRENMVPCIYFKEVKNV